jgi:hypothetical protein
MKKYYKSNFITDDNLISKEEVEKIGHHYEVEYSIKTGNLFAKFFVKNQLLSVTYYDTKFDSDLYNYSKDNFGEIKIIIWKNISIYTKRTEIYNEGKLSSIWILKYDENNRLNISILLNNEDILIEYRKHIYDDNGIQIKEKIFFADTWTIHEENLD